MQCTKRAALKPELRRTRVGASEGRTGRGGSVGAGAGAGAGGRGALPARLVSLSLLYLQGQVQSSDREVYRLRECSSHLKQKQRTVR